MPRHPLKTLLLSIFSIAFLLPIYSANADYVDGEEANRQGDRDTAFKEFYQAAHNKDIRAYGKLGSMYLYGLGTTKDYQQAYIWFHMAYLSGEREGERFRDAASSMLTREKYLESVKLAEIQRKKQELGKTPPQNHPPVPNRAPLGSVKH